LRQRQDQLTMRPALAAAQPHLNVLHRHWLQRSRI